MQPDAKPDAGRVKRAGRRRKGGGPGMVPGLRWALIGAGLAVATGLGLIGFKLMQTERRLAEYQQQATAAADAASAAEAEAQAARAKEEAARTEAAAAAASAVAAQRALAEAEAKAAAAAQASADEQARTEREAAELRAAQERAREESEAKAAAAEATRLAAEQARKTASEQTRRSEEAKTRLQRAGSPPAPAAAPVAAAAAGGSASQLDIPNWPLRAGCGGGEVNVNGKASFSIQPQGDGVLVQLRYLGGSGNSSGSSSSGGYTAEFSGQQAFDRLQPSYEVTARGEFKGPRSFGAAWTVRIDAGAGNAPRSARGLRFQSDC